MVKKIHLTLDSTEAAILDAAARIYVALSAAGGKESEQDRILKSVETATRLAELVETKVRTGRELG